MDLTSALILAFVQGILEWFPVSSSGHLSLFQNILGLDNGLDLQVALHFGTLMAVFVYFRNDIVSIFRDFLQGNWKTSNSRLGFLLLVASIPAGIFGFIFRSYFELSSGLFILGFGWVITSVTLFIGSFTPKKNKKDIGYMHAFMIGIAQMLALIPGVSRSGMTISSGLFFGLNEKDAIKFSYLLSIPVIFGANLVTFGNETIPIEYLFPTVVCFVLGLIFMTFSFKYILSNRKNLRWFGFYTLVLGIVSLVYAFS
ncbi:MAG: undecaprenyl-diphosphate phosphatase [Nanoarchaeota archaeon]